MGVDAFPGVAGGVLGLVPAETGLVLGAIPAPLQFVLGLAPGRSGTAGARFPAVLVGRAVIVVGVAVGGIGTGIEVVTPVGVFGGRIDRFRDPLAGEASG